MSVIVAIKDGNKVLMGSDSQATVGRTIINGQSKIIERNGWLIGFAGNYRLYNILNNELEIVEDENVYTIVSRIGELFEDYEGEFNILMAKDDRLYSVHDDLAILDIKDDCIAVGSGADLALGSILTPNKDKSVEERLGTALDVAIALDIYCGGDKVIKETI